MILAKLDKYFCNEDWNIAFFLSHPQCPFILALRSLPLSWKIVTLALEDWNP
jgi:hypothetical protein